MYVEKFTDGYVTATYWVVLDTGVDVLALYEVSATSIISFLVFWMLLRFFLYSYTLHLKSATLVVILQQR